MRDILLNIPYKSFRVFLIIMAISIIVFISVLNIKVYDVYNTYAIYQNSHLILNIPINYSDTITNAEYFKIDDEKYEFEVLSVSEILVDTNAMINYQEVIISYDKVMPENTIVNVSIYYDQEKVLEKIKNLI